MPKELQGTAMGRGSTQVVGRCSAEHGVSSESIIIKDKRIHLEVEVGHTPTARSTSPNELCSIEDALQMLASVPIP